MPTTIAADNPLTSEEKALIPPFIEFLQRVSRSRDRGPHGEILRFNQGRVCACVDAELAVPDGLPERLRVGLFAAPQTYQAVIRFANATSSSDRDADTRGMAISVLNTGPANLTPGETRQDFILNSHPVMPSPGPREFKELLEAFSAGGFRTGIYFLTHFKSARIALAARDRPSCHLDIPYWSTVPYAFGANQKVKYTATPSSARRSTRPDRLTDNYLRDAMRAHLAQDGASFDLKVQFHKNDTDTPIEDATVEWKTPWETVARITIPKQSIDNAVRESHCEQMAFNPWHALPEHRPLGGMNRVRQEIYRAMAEFRRKGGTT